MSEQPPTADAHAPRVAQGLRYLAAALLVIVAAAAAYGAVFANWADAVLLDTPTFMEAIEPLADDAGVRARASDAISDTVTDVIDLRGLADSIAPGVDLPGVEQLATGFDSFVRSTVGAAVRTDAFANLWLGEMRRWHIKLVGAVRATGEESVAEGVVMRVTLGPYVDLLAEQAESAIVRRIITSLVPDTVRQMRVVVFDTALVADRLELLRALDRARPYLPWAAAAALLLACVAAPRARHALLGAGFLLAAGGVLARVAVQREAARIEVLMQSAFSASEESASGFAVALLGPLETWIGYAVLAGLLAAAVGAVLTWGAQLTAARRA